MRDLGSDDYSDLLAIFIAKTLLRILLGLFGDIGVLGSPDQDLVSSSLGERAAYSRFQPTNDVARVLLGVVVRNLAAIKLFV